MKTHRGIYCETRRGVVYAFCACVAGCAVPGASSVTTATATTIGAGSISADNARDAITTGKSTKADVIAALGQTKVISFDSGFEVWVYQIKGDAPAGASRAGKPANTEFVVLFAPSGVVKKTRIRPPGDSKGT